MVRELVTIGQLLYGVWVAKACEPPKAASWAEFTMPEGSTLDLVPYGYWSLL